MKATELRANSWVLEEGVRLRQITALGIYHVEQGFVDVFPIPLTEDILLKCGFEVSGESFIKACFSIEDVHNGDTWYLYMYDEDNECDVHVGIIKYLHQLQNLYFALTGSELNINM